MDENAIAKNDSLIEPPKAKPEKKTKAKKGTGTGIVICFVLLAIMITAAYVLSQNMFFNGAEALVDGYQAAFASERETTYQMLYQKFYDSAEVANHVTNRANIFIGNIRETEKLEVLKVSDVEFIVEDSGNNSGNITSWLEVPGEGTFIVDLSAAEFIVDNERSHVRVRLPYPELTNVAIDYSNVKKILFKDDVFNGSYKQGEELAMKQLGEADLLIKKEFASNQHFYMNAQAAAITTVQCLIRQLNPNIESLSVEVEFY